MSVCVPIYVSVSTYLCMSLCVSICWYFAVDENAEVSIRDVAQMVVEAMDFQGPLVVSHT